MLSSTIQSEIQTDSVYGLSPSHLNFPKPKNVDLRTMRMLNQEHLCGYNPYRGDFDVEYDNDAEDLMCIAAMLNDDYENDNSSKSNKSEDLKKLTIDLQLALADCYNSCLKERQKRKYVVKTYGLLNRKGFSQWLTKLQVQYM